MALGFSLSKSSPPARRESILCMTCGASILKAPVITGFFEYFNMRNNLYLSAISSGTSEHMRAVL
ncbi:MAG: hypothetical protein BWY64_02420 [bacterium ADurb.Bin363]|nr:MAG: hypothetical protein BWY64_02420 [bacterium ADurb.Bin363]